MLLAFVILIAFILIWISLIKMQEYGNKYLNTYFILLVTTLSFFVVWWPFGVFSLVVLISYFFWVQEKT